MDRCTESDYFVGIQPDVWLAMKQIFHERPNLRNACRSTNQNHFVDLLRLEIRVLESLFAGAHGAIDDRLDQLLELLASNFALIALVVREFDIKFH